MTLLWAGFLLGCAFGIAARLGRFCLLRGLRQWLGKGGRRLVRFLRLQKEPQPQSYLHQVRHRFTLKNQVRAISCWRSERLRAGLLLYRLC